MKLDADITAYLRKSPYAKAREISAALGVERSQVNSLLYRSINVRYRVDGEYRWSLVDAPEIEATPASAPIDSVAAADIVDDAAMLRARRTLARLKRGVPPADAIESLAIGMERLQQQLARLLADRASPRWLAVTGEYGEGKSFFRAFASHKALSTGFAVVSLDVNKDEGALHQPQRHLSVLLQSMLSPLPSFEGHQGFNSLFRHWFAHTAPQQIQATFERMRLVEPWLPVSRDVTYFSYLTHGSPASIATDGRLVQLLRYLSAEDLVIKGNYARFTAAYRLQLMLEWLGHTSHRGLFLFIDELDNVVRQIHGKAHPACFRTLGWYCANNVTPGLRVAFATTPEVMAMLDAGDRDDFGDAILGQKTVLMEEHEIYEQWNRQAATYARQGWERCVTLDPVQRVELFQKILEIHRRAWGAAVSTDFDEVRRMAFSGAFTTTRRWVRACIQLLDLSHQHISVH